jgi:hypothetical protein
MSENIYFNSLRGKKSKYGVKITGKVEDVIKELYKNQNEKGYINLELLERREADQYGNTHYVQVDKWEPQHAATEVHQGPIKPTSISSPVDDLPF